MTAEDIARQQVFLSLTPFFLEAAAGDPDRARAAAEAAVAGFAPASMEQLLLVAQIIVYGFAGLDSMRRSAAEPGLPVSTHLRLRGNGNAMNRAVQQCRKALEALRRQKPTAAPAPLDAPPDAQPHGFSDADLQDAIRRASAIIAEARTAGHLPVMNRKARRAAHLQAQRAARAAATQAGATAPAC